MSDQNFQLLLVEDDPDLREAICTTLKMARVPYVAVESAENALGALDDAAIQLIVTDFRLPGMNGLELLEQASKRRHDLPVVVMTAFADTQLAVRALKLGAKDFLIKPFLPQQLLEIVQRYQPRPAGDETQNSPNIIAVDPATIAALKRCERIAGTDASVLLLGESGVGKDVFARRVHQLSNRRAKPFVALNCAAIPETLLESTLFGFERGAFTGANRSQQGKFEQANEGTLFLDEIGEMPLELQAKMLRVLQDKIIEPLGANRQIRCDIRIIAATNQNLAARVKSGAFREDLYFRLAVMTIAIPPLRDRPADILPLAEMMLLKYGRTMGRSGGVFADDARRALLAHSWPGNVRELENCVQRALLISDDPEIHALDLEIEGLIANTGGIVGPNPVVGTELAALTPSTNDLAAMETVEREHILRVLAHVDGNRRKAAEVLGLSERGLRYKLKTYVEAGYLKDQS